MARAVFDVLVQQNADGEYEGNLAEAIEPNDDFTEWTMTLRPDITFHNGVPLTAQTIVDMFAIQQTGATSSGQLATYSIAGIEAVDDLTVIYTLSSPNSAFPAAVNSVPIGYVFEPGAAAEDPDEGTRLDALISGTVDLMETRRQGTIRDALAESGISLFEFQGNNTGGGMFNAAVPPFDDVRVRLGLNKLNDQERVIEALGGTGISQPVTQWFPADSPWWTQEAADVYPTFDFEGAPPCCRSTSTIRLVPTARRLVNRSMSDCRARPTRRPSQRCR
jgi:peptide/nickel transport system substrate-binding protein